MHIAINAWFWNRPDTGSGQYVRRLVEALTRVARDVRLTLVVPAGWSLDTPPGVGVEHALTTGSGDWAKLRFEQVGFPHTVSQIGADLAHVPYWAGPLSSPVPIIITIHDLIPLLLPAYRGNILARLYTGLVAASARGAAAILTDSRAAGEDIARHLAITADRIYPIPLAAGSEYTAQPNLVFDMAVSRKYNLPSEYVLYLGGYDVRKNVENLIKAFTYVTTGYDIPLVLAGRLPGRPTARFIDVHHYIHLMGMADRVQIIGEVDEADKPALYRLARTFVYPSRYEGFGLPVLEAMACGKPVVVSSAPALVELVSDAAFTADPDDARRLAGSILATLTDARLAQELSQKALARAGEFSWERTAAMTLEVYQQAAG